MHPSPPPHRRLDPFGTIPDAEIKQRSVNGGLATLTAQGVMSLVQIGSTVVLARILTKEDFGLQGMVIALTGILNLFRDAGLSVPTVQKERITHAETSTLFWINLALGAGLTLFGFAMSPFVAAFYGEPRLVPIMAASSCGFLLNALGIQHRALLTRMMQFRSLGGITILAQVLSAVVGISMGLSGFGYWSLVVMALTTPTVVTAGVWMTMRWMPSRPDLTGEVRAMVRMGGGVTLTNVVSYVALNVEKILLGRYWGAAALGLYGRAVQLANMPLDQLNGALSSVALPALARVQSDPERLCRTFFMGYSVVVSFAITVVLVCAQYSEQLVGVVFGREWLDAAPVVRLLAPSILSFALMAPFGWLLQATGRVQRSLQVALLTMPVMLVGVSLGIPKGPEGVAMGYSIATLALVVPVVVWSKAGLQMPAIEYFHSVRQPFVAGIAAYVFAWYFKGHWMSGRLSWELVSGVGSMLLVYLLVLVLSAKQRNLFLELGRQIGARRRTSTAR